MTTTQLEDLVTQAVERTVLTTVTRHSERVTELLVEEILKDPATRAQFATLIQTALTQALDHLRAPALKTVP